MWLWIGFLCLLVPKILAVDSQTCSGTSNGLNDNEINKYENPIIKLKQIFENCKSVAGNLEIVRITQEHLDSEGGPEALNFLSSIEQVHGYVLIAYNQIKSISLPNLQIIWGDTLFKTHTVGYSENNSSSLKEDGNYSLFIYDNEVLETLDLQSLRVVQTGTIGQVMNNYLCHWQSLDYRQLMGDDYDRRLYLQSNYKRCDDPSLKPLDCWHGCKTCFGPLESQCQKIYRDNCAEQCPNKMCFNTSSLSPKFCCNSQCAAGCFGPNDTQCYGCSRMQNGNRCVEKCPPLERYNHRITQFEPTEDGKYAYFRHCVDKCPNHYLTYRDGCVSRCPPNHEVDAKRHCIPCVGSCHKTCYIHEFVSEININEFENCTEVQGFIHIGKMTFEDGKNYYHDKDAKNYKGITVEDLELLSNVQVVTDYVIIQAAEPLTNLNFLRNLRVIEGRQLFNSKVAMQIQGADLEYFGMVNLKTITYGEVWIEGNHELCYIYDIPWKDEIATTNGIGDRINKSRVVMENNRQQKLCNESWNICDQSCDMTKGCWGPGSHMCYECKRWKLNNNCIETCQIDNGFYESSRKVCEACHPECLTCNGSTSFNCLQCRHVKRDGECLAECPSDTHYLNTSNNVCVHCHENCYQFGCSGPGNFVGIGGCRKCRYGVYNEVAQTVSPCLYEISSQDHCSKNAMFSNYFWSSPNNPKFAPLVERGVCIKCLNVCKSCSNYGKSEKHHDCVCSSHRVFHRDSPEHADCSFSCPANSYPNVSSLYANVTDCYPCDPQCDGCYGPSSSECLYCKNFKVTDDVSTSLKFNCTEICPENIPFVLTDKTCSDMDLEKIIGKDAKTTNVIIVVIMATIFLALIVVCIVAFVFRRRSMILTKLNMPEDCYEMNLDAKPDLSQLKLITELELKRGGVLGYGAFGTVFKGVWTPLDNQKMKFPVAIKVLHEAQSSAQQDMLDEASHMARVNHPYLLKLIGVCLSQQMMLITPLMPLGNLLEYIEKNRAKIGSSALLRWCSQIASGMAYLEELRLVHRDLAARNVLVQNPYRIRITDFGLAKMLDYGEQEVKIVEGKMPIKWLALECIQYRRYTHKSDVWAYGVTVWELLTFGDKPYKDVQLMQIPNLLEKGERLSQPKVCTLDVYMILIKCWMVDADSRPSFKELHETFNKMSKDPGRYLVIEGDKLLRLPSYSTQDQRDMIRQLVDEEDICDPDEYLHDLTIPSSPTSPVTPSKPLMSDVEVLPRNGQRLHSTTSHRYASDPLKVRNKTVLTMDLDNYLVPDSQALPQTSPASCSSSFPTVTYTPVVTGQISTPDCISKHVYYNDLPTPNGHTRNSSDTDLADNCEYLIPNSSQKNPNSNSLKKRRLNYDKTDELIQSETVV